MRLTVCNAFDFKGDCKVGEASGLVEVMNETFSVGIVGSGEALDTL